jgi:hypothetical protein
MAKAKERKFEAPRDVPDMVRRFRQLKPGKYRLTILRDVPRRSDRQNNFYHPAFCEPLAEWLTETQGETFTMLDAHEFFKNRYLLKPVVDSFGEVLGYVTGSTTTLNTEEFNEYLDKCGQFLVEFCDIPIPDPADYHERENRKREDHAKLQSVDRDRPSHARHRDAQPAQRDDRWRERGGVQPQVQDRQR